MLTPEQRALVEKWAGLAQHFAKNYPHKFYPDLIQSGMLQVCKLALTYRNDRDCSFWTYAWKAVKSAIHRQYRLLQGCLHEYPQRIRIQARRELASVDVISESQIGPPGQQDVLENLLARMGICYDPWHELECQQEVEDLLRTLKPRWQQIIRMRFGIGDGGPKLLKDMAEEMGISRQAVCEMQRKAIRKIREEASSTQSL